jgi:hypothetical protein
MTTTNLDDWLNQQPPPVESAACFNGDCTHCPDPVKCPHGCHRQAKERLLEAVKAGGRYASFGVITTALLDVIDDWCQRDTLWTLNSRDEEQADEARERFTSDVTRRIARLQSPPFELDSELRKEQR